MTNRGKIMQTLCPMIENALDATLGDNDRRVWFIATYAGAEVLIASNIDDPATVRRLAESVVRNVEQHAAETHVAVSTPDAKQ